MVKNRIDEIIIKFDRNPQVCAGQPLSEPYLLDGCPVVLGYGPWPSQPDVLCKGDVFCGLAYPVPNEYLDVVMSWIRPFQSDFVRLIKVSDAGHGERYREVLRSEYYFEVLWTDEEPNKVILAALIEDAWLYRQVDMYTDLDAFDAVVGVSLNLLDDIVSAFGLRLPEQFIEHSVSGR